MESRPRFLPHMDVMETESHFEVSFDLPGISPDEVEIEVNIEVTDS